MAKKTIKIRAKLKDDIVTVKALMTHPMETGARKDKSGALIPAHFIQEVTCESGGKTPADRQLERRRIQEPLSLLQIQGSRQGRHD